MEQRTVNIQDLGAIKNHLKILSDDKRGFHPKTLKKVTGLNFKQLSEVTGMTRPRMYDEVVTPKPSSNLMRKIIHVVMSADVVYELMNNNGDDTALWLSTPNAAFVGYSPFEVCLQGRGEDVLKWLEIRAGKKPGTGF